MNFFDDWLREVVCPEIYPDGLLSETELRFFRDLFHSRGGIGAVELIEEIERVQVTCASNAVALLEEDLRRTRGSVPVLEVVVTPGRSVRVSVDGEFDLDDSGGLMCLLEPHIAEEVATSVQRIVLELYSPWPMCKAHDRVMILEAEPTPTWVCRAGHSIAPIGSLSSDFAT